MNRPYVEQLRIQNYGCIQDATVHLTPLHALVGPADSGKSTILRALQTAALCGSESMPLVLQDAWSRSARRPESGLEVRSGGLTWQLQHDAEGVLHERAGDEDRVAESLSGFGCESLLASEPLQPLQAALRGCRLLQLDADALRSSSHLINAEDRIELMDERGSGLAGVYDALLGGSDEVRDALTRSVREQFPGVSRVTLLNQNGAKALGVTLKDGTKVPAELMGEGLLTFLVHAALPYLEPCALLLVEAPERALHAAQIPAVMKLLRALSETTQVVVATHSARVVDALQPGEVSEVTRPDGQGTQVQRLHELSRFGRERS